MDYNKFNEKVNRLKANAVEVFAMLDGEIEGTTIEDVKKTLKQMIEDINTL
jgi:uncharacterized protein (DUF2267 family)